MVEMKQSITKLLFYLVDNGRYKVNYKQKNGHPPIGGRPSFTLIKLKKSIFLKICLNKYFLH